MTTKLSFGQAIKTGLSAGVVAAAINSVLFLLFRSLGLITDDVFVQPDMPMTVVPVIISSLVPSVLAGMVYYLLDRFTANGYRNFLILSIVLLLLSFANPFMMIPNVPVSYGIALDLMHVTVVVSLLYFLRRATTPTGKVVL
ncbi:DUF6069 family protein [Telluribacter humicola]|uniref:DUF6069 family protein n=1 Tax=Telluribacter humicola TaxID=1720261 RepID=UPI001A977517|nr:DUF6069 family protein [Telluribacter humicola]